MALPHTSYASDQSDMLMHAFKAKKLNPVAFDPNTTTASNDEVHYLGLFIQAAHRAAIARTYRMLAIEKPAGGNAEQYTHEWYTQQTDYILNTIKMFDRRNRTPESLIPARDKLIEAIELQQRVFGDIHLVKGTPVYKDVIATYKDTVRVKKSHAALGASYAAMLEAFPDEPALNKEAFRNSLLVVSFLDP